MTTSAQGAFERGSLENSKQRKPFRIFDFAFRRLPLILGVGIPLFLILRLLVVPLTHPIYKVEGSLLIQPTKEPTVTGRERESIQGDVGFFQRTLVLRITDREVVAAALRNLPDSDRPDFLKGLGESDRAIYSLISKITAKEVERTYLIRVSLQAGNADGLAETLRALLESLIDKLENEQETQFSSRLNYLKNERERIASRASHEKVEILGLAARFQDQSMLREDYSTDLGKMNLIQKLYWEAQADTLAKAADLQRAENDRETLAKLSLVPFAEERVSDNFGINQIERWTYEKSQDLRATIDGLTPTNPDRKYVEERMLSMNEYMAAYKKRVSDETIKNLTEKRDFELQDEIIKARNAYEAAQSTSQKLEKELESAIEEATAVSEAIFEASGLNFGLSQLRDRLASINNRIDDVELEAKSPLPVIIDNYPTRPLKPTSSNAQKLQLMALMLSFGLIGGICFLFDLLDDRVRCREELGAAIGGKGANPIPALSGDDEDPAFANLIVDNPGHVGALALRELALRLVFERNRSGAKFITFVGSHPRSGNSSIALNIARALSGHGLSVVLAELPTPTPGLARLAGLATPEAVPSPWGNKVPDPRSGAALIPWLEGMDPARVRSSLDTFFSSAADLADLVVLDVRAPADCDISEAAALKSDVVVISARENIARYDEVRSIVETAAAGSVPAVTAVLNFATDATLQTRLSNWIRQGQSALSKAHGVFRQRGITVARSGLAKAGASPQVRKFGHRKANTPDQPENPKEPADNNSTQGP